VSCVLKNLIFARNMEIARSPSLSLAQLRKQNEAKARKPEVAKEAEAEPAKKLDEPGLDRDNSTAHEDGDKA
jgi:hypothetical protein